MKVWNYIMLLTGMIILFEIAGINTGMANLLSTFGVQGLGTGSLYFAFSTSTFFNNIFSVTGILASVGVATAVIGAIRSSNPENYVILGFITSTLVLFVSAFVNIIAQANTYDNWVSVLVFALMAPLAVGYVLALVDYFRGRD